MSDMGTVTAEDVDDLNRAALDRSAAFARIGGTALIGIGLLALAAWVWLTVRTQQEAAPAGFGSFDMEAEDISLGERITLLSSNVVLLTFAAITAGLGLFLRMAADLGQIKAGGSVTGLREGDAVPYDDVDEE